jgi:hypothetical protein
MQTEELRALLLHFLGTWDFKQNPSLQWNDCLRGVSHLVRERSSMRDESERQLPRDDMVRLKEVVWDLIIARVLSPGWSHSSESTWPMLSLTDHGQKVVSEKHPVPYDPDGYLARLQQATGGLGGSLLRYLEEALSTFRMSNYLAAAVMLGAASEMLFLEVRGAISKAIRDEQLAMKFDERTGPKKTMSDRVKAVMEWISQNRPQLLASWQERERVGLADKVADLIRDRRNEAGHPQDPPRVRSREEIYALICLFPDYCIKFYELKNWLEQRPRSIGTANP